MDAERPYRLMVTGSRFWAADLWLGNSLRPDAYSMPSLQRDIMVAALRGARERAGARVMVVVHGDAAGADRLAGALATRSAAAEEELWPALWRRAPDGTFPENVGGKPFGNLPPYYRDEALYMRGRRGAGGYDPRAGFSRNEAMLESDVAEVLAFLAKGQANKGTRGAVNSARRRGVPVIEHTA